MKLNLKNPQNTLLTNKTHLNETQTKAVFQLFLNKILTFDNLRGLFSFKKIVFVYFWLILNINGEDKGEVQYDEPDSIISAKV